jgi:hypothetical protein
MAGSSAETRRSHATSTSQSRKRSWIALIITSIAWMVGSCFHTYRYQD